MIFKEHSNGTWMVRSDKDKYVGLILVRNSLFVAIKEGRILGRKVTLEEAQDLFGS